jgi:hypothetical protein
MQRLSSVRGSGGTPTTPTGPSEASRWPTAADVGPLPAESRRGAALPSRRMVARRGLVLHGALVLVAATALAVAITWPLAAHFNTAVQPTHDLTVQAWAIDWVQHALTSDAGLIDANIFAPAPDALSFSDALLAIAVPELLLRPPGVEPIGMVNLALLAGVAANAAAAYWLGWLLLRRVLAGAVCAAAYAIGPYSMLTAGHVHVLVRPGLPIAVGLIWLIADRWSERTTPADRPVSPRLRTLFVLLALTIASPLGRYPRWSSRCPTSRAATATATTGSPSAA